jgi:protein SCO1/2
MVDHLAVAFLMGPDGKPIASLPIDKDGQAIAGQVKHWVR